MDKDKVKDKDKEKDKDKNEGGVGETEFDGFWSIYPKKAGKQDALKAWKKLKPGHDLLAIIMTKLKAQSASHDWQKDGGKFVPHPATWLNGHRWEDEVKDFVPSNGRIVGGAAPVPGKYDHLG